MGGKYSNVLTMLLVILIVAILGVVGYFGYDILNSRAVNSNANSASDEFEEALKEKNKNKAKKVSDEDEEENSRNNSRNGRDILDKLGNSNTTQTETEETEAEKVYMEGYEVKGIIEIPKTGIKYPVLENVTKKSLETAVAIAYGPGLNEVGNTIIYGHNYRNGLFFSDNKKLSKGDEVYITDQKGEKVVYTIYNIYQTTPNDASYMTRDTAGRREISLQTCTDDSSGRIIVWAAEKGSIEL